MLCINKISSAEPIDFAASELKKYLRMMMPDGPDVKISYDFSAKKGFRLGLMSDFGLDTSDAEDVYLDDILYIDCDTEGGIIAGSNPRSVLLAVYEYLRQNGCRWLYPGTDGEFIPAQEIVPVKLRHKPSMRCRGFAAEGSVYQDSVLNMLDFLPKVGMNTFMIEFRLPRSYYAIYYMHLRNLKNRPSEPISETQVMQWKRESETEMAKRGLLFHDVGHGWTIDPFGVDSKHSWRKVDPSIVPKESIQYLAEIGGKRGLFEDTPINTNFCMSNPTARKMFCDYVVKYAEEHPNADYLQVWLADSVNNHCECDECRKKIPSDYYVILMNELDEALTAKSLPTRIAFIAYLDTVFPPLVEKIKNFKRFSLMFAYISRNYADTAVENQDTELKPYVRNKIPRLGALSDALRYYQKWRESYDGDGIVFEYHFWRHLYYDISGLQMAARIFEDVALYRANGFRGFIENGTLRPFFPTGIAFYTYAKCLYDETLSFEDICRDYFSHIYGKDYKDFVSYFEKLNELFPYRFTETNALSGGMKKSLDFGAGFVEKLNHGIEDVLAYGRKLVEEHYNSDMRVQTVSVRLLEKHLRYVELYADSIRKKALNENEAAKEALDVLLEEMGKEEIYIQPYYDHNLNSSGLGYYFNLDSNPYISIGSDV